MKFLLQLFLCLLVLGAAAVGFVALKSGQNPVAAIQTMAGKPAAEASGKNGADHQANGDTKAGSEQTQNDAAPKAAPVAVTVVKKSAMSPSIELYGTVETPRETRLTSGITADVISVGPLEGQQVQQGDTLVELDGADIRLTIAQREAELSEIDSNAAAQQRRHRANVEALQSEKEILALSQRQYERYAKLATRQIGTRAAADDAARAVKQHELAITNRQNAIDEHATTMAGIDARKARVKAQIEQAKRDLERTRIKAPFTGRITTVNVSPGNRVRAGDPIATVYDTAFVEIRAQVPNRYVGQIERSLATGNGIAGTGGLEGQTFNVRLDRLAARSRSGTGGVDALIRIVDSQPPQLGRTVNVSIDLPPIPDAFAVPTTAINDSGNVFVVRQGLLATGSVTRLGTIEIDGANLLLVSSETLQDGDAIVISQIPSARDGMPVKITN